MAKAQEMIDANFLVNLRFGHLAQCNALRNMPRVKESITIQTLRSSLRSTEAILWAAGPSLDEAIQECGDNDLWERANQRINIVADSAIPAMLKTPLHIDIAASLEAADIKSRMTEGCSEDTILLAVSQCHPNTVKNFNHVCFALDPIGLTGAIYASLNPYLEQFPINFASYYDVGRFMFVAVRHIWQTMYDMQVRLDGIPTMIAGMDLVNGHCAGYDPEFTIEFGPQDSKVSDAICRDGKFRESAGCFDAIAQQWKPSNNMKNEHLTSNIYGCCPWGRKIGTLKTMTEYLDKDIEKTFSPEMLAKHIGQRKVKFDEKRYRQTIDAVYVFQSNANYHDFEKGVIPQEVYDEQERKIVMDSVEKINPYLPEATSAWGYEPMTIHIPEAGDERLANNN